jgi:uncharacterized membrane protein YgcG
MDEILKVIAEPLGTLLLVLINAGIAMAVRWIHQNTKSENIKLATDTLSTVVQAEVARLNQQVVKALKNDGKFSDNEKGQIKESARRSIREQLTPAVQKGAGYVVQDLERLIDALIEQAVVEAKAAPPQDSVRLVMTRKKPTTPAVGKTPSQEP